MDKITPDDVVAGRTSGVRRETVEKWLSEAGIDVINGQALTTLRHPQISGGSRTLPFPLDQQERITGDGLREIAHICRRVDERKKSLLRPDDDLPDWLPQLLDETPFSAKLHGQKLVVHATRFPEFKLDMYGDSLNEAKVTSQVNKLSTSFASYIKKLKELELEGWHREYADNTARLVHAEKEPLTLAGDIPQLLGILEAAKPEKSLEGFTSGLKEKEGVHHVDVQPIVENVKATDVKEKRPAVVVPVADATEAKSAYEAFREAERHKAEYEQAESAAISSARYKVEQHAFQNGCSELECRLKSRKSGYEIQMIFGKNGKAQPSEYVPLRGVTHIDDAMDIFLQLESTLFSEFARDKKPEGFIEPPMRDLHPSSNGPAPKPRVNIINILRNEKNIPQGVIELDPASVPIVNDYYAVAEPPKKRKAFTEAKIVDAGDKGMLVVHCWYATEKGNTRTCSQLNIPLGIDFSNKTELKERSAFAINFMKEAVAEGRVITPQDVVNGLREEVTKRSQKWKNPETHYVPGFEIETPLNFPDPMHQQETRMTAATLQHKLSKNAGHYYALQFRFKIRDAEVDGGQWHEMAARGINLRTNDPELAEARGERMMADVKELFETTLVQGQSDKKSILLPSNWRWDMSAVKSGKLYTPRDRGKTSHVRRASPERLSPIDVDNPILNGTNVIAFIDHAIGTYEDDLKTTVHDIERGKDQTRFVLTLMHGTRDARENAVSPAEPLLLANPHKANGFLPTEIVFYIDNNGRTQEQVDKRIEDFAANVGTSTRDKATIDYRASVTAGDRELPKIRKRFNSATMVNDFVASIRSHIRTFEDVEVGRDELNDAIRSRFTTAPRPAEGNVPWVNRSKNGDSVTGQDGAANGR